MKLWYTKNPPFTSYTTVTPHGDSREAIFLLTRRHVQYIAYKIIACIERATVLRANIVRVTRECEGVLSYSRLTN